MLDEWNEHVEQPVGVDPEHPASQPMVAPERLHPLARNGNEIFDDRGRDVVAVQRRVERGLVFRARA